METKFNTIAISAFSNADAHAFHGVVLKEAETIQDDNIAKILNVYQEDLLKLDALLVSASQERDPKLSDADKERDSIYQRARAFAKAAANHYDVRVAQAAAVVYSAFKANPDPLKATLNQETSILKVLISNLEEISPEILEQSQCKGWVEQLKLSQESYEAALLKQNEETSSKGTGAVKAIREKLLADYRGLTQMVESFVFVGGREDLEGYISRINAYIQKLVQSKKAKKEGDDLSQSETVSHEGAV